VIPPGNQFPKWILKCVIHSEIFMGRMGSIQRTCSWMACSSGAIALGFFYSYHRQIYISRAWVIWPFSDFSLQMTIDTVHISGVRATTVAFWWVFVLWLKNALLPVELLTPQVHFYAFTHYNSESGIKLTVTGHLNQHTVAYWLPQTYRFPSSAGQ